MTTQPDTEVRAPSAPPYISFKTVTNLITRLEPESPPRIDGTVLGYLSGGYRSQVLTALRWLELIDADGKPSPQLTEMVRSSQTRGETIRRVLESRYADIFSAIDMGKATVGQLEEQFDKFGMAVETRKKATTFFVHGCKFAEIPLSSYIAGGVKRSRSVSRRTPKSGTTGGGGNNGSGVTTPPASPLAVPVHPMLSGAIQWLAENAAGWTAEQATAWCDQFVGSVRLVYPPNATERKKLVAGAASSATNDDVPNPVEQATP